MPWFLICRRYLNSHLLNKVSNTHAFQDVRSEVNMSDKQNVYSRSAMLSTRSKNVQLLFGSGSPTVDTRLVHWMVFYRYFIDESINMQNQRRIVMITQRGRGDCLYTQVKCRRTGHRHSWGVKRNKKTGDIGKRQIRKGSQKETAEQSCIRIWLSDSDSDKHTYTKASMFT